MAAASTRRTFLSLLDRCTIIKHLHQLHARLAVTSLFLDTVLLSRLIDFSVDASRGDDLSYAHALFSSADCPTLFMYNSMIKGHSFPDKEPRLALSFYQRLRRHGHAPDNFTFPFVLRAAGLVCDHPFGRRVHCQIIKSGHESNVYVSCSSVNMYMSCGDMNSAQLVFENATDKSVVCWTTMISGYVENGRSNEAISLFKEMVAAGVEPNEITVVRLLAACAQAKDFESGKWVHERIRRSGSGWMESNVVVATAVVDFYGRCGSLLIARDLFDRMRVRNVVSWNAMYSAYNQHERYNEVMELNACMAFAGVRPDKVTLLVLLSACARGSGYQAFGRVVHGYIEKTSLRGDMALSTSLIDVYAKAGDTNSAFKIFKRLESRDVLVWTSMIKGLAENGQGKEALDLYEEMLQKDIKPDRVTFIAVLTACSHSGLLDEGRKHFGDMKKIYAIEPELEHYSCMVNLLSRAGHSVEVKRLVETMPIRPSVEIWGAILSGCEFHDDLDLIERASKKLVELGHVSSGVHVLLSNIYAEEGRWDRVESTRELMKHEGIKKSHGYSCIQTQT